MDEISYLDFESEVRDITAAVTARCETIVLELSERLDEGGLSTRDAVALTTAVGKAAVAGASEARALLRACLLREERLDIGEPLTLPIVDVWLERFGDEPNESE